MVAGLTQYDAAIQLVETADFNANFDAITEGASDIALLSQNIEQESFSHKVDVSVFSGEEEEPMPAKDVKVDKQILNISQIANSSELSSVQKGNEHEKG